MVFDATPILVKSTYGLLPYERNTSCEVKNSVPDNYAFSLIRLCIREMCGRSSLCAQHQNYANATPWYTLLYPYSWRRVGLVPIR